VPIDRYSFESVELLKDIVARWGMRRELAIAKARLAGASEARAERLIPEVSLYAIDVSFDAIEDPQERRYFMDLPTSFVLPPEAVDRLREVAGQLLRASPQYQLLVQDLGGKPQ
jgi:NTE family protein